MLPTIELYHKIRDIPRIPEHFLEPKSVKIWWFSIAFHQATPQHHRSGQHAHLAQEVLHKWPSDGIPAQSTTKQVRTTILRSQNRCENQIWRQMRLNGGAHMQAGAGGHTYKEDDRIPVELKSIIDIALVHVTTSRSMKQHWWNVSLAHSVIKSDWHELESHKLFCE